MLEFNDEKDAEIITLRAHHAACLHFFTGHGYDEVFTDKMTKLKQRLTESPKVLIRLTDGCDILCASCPNNRGGCVQDVKSHAYDTKWLVVLGFEAGEIIGWDELEALVNTKLKDRELLKTVCGGCEWYEALCSKF